MKEARAPSSPAWRSPDLEIRVGISACLLGEPVRYDGRHKKDGYILKRASPSCGMERVKVYTEAGMPSKSGRGLFARRLLEAYPLLPVEEEGRLADPGLRDNWGL